MVGSAVSLKNQACHEDRCPRIGVRILLAFADAPSSRPPLLLTIWVAASLRPCLRCAAVVQIIGAADERELYTSAAQSFRLFEENVYSRAAGMSDRGHSRGDEACEEQGSRSGSLYPPRFRPPAKMVSRAMVKEMQKENLIQFERLEEAVDR